MTETGQRSDKGKDTPFKTPKRINICTKVTTSLLYIAPGSGRQLLHKPERDKSYQGQRQESKKKDGHELRHAKFTGH